MKTTEDFPVVTKIVMGDTFKLVEPGKSVKFDCRQLGSYGSARSTISRINRSAGWNEFSITSDDNGATYTVTRHEAPR